MTALAAIHVARKQLGLDDDTYRALLKRVTGKASSREMSEAERRLVVAAMTQQGFNASRTGLEGPFAKKLQALWIAGWNLGLVVDKTDAALTDFVTRQTGIAHPRFLIDAADAARAVEGLKGWLARAVAQGGGGVDWSDGNHLPKWQRHPGAKVALAQWTLLDPEAGFQAFKAFVEDHAFNPIQQMTAREWQGVMNTLGCRVRATRRAG